MSSKTDDRAVRMQCIQLANSLAMACKVNRSESVISIARNYFRFITEGNGSEIITTVSDGMTADEVSAIVERALQATRSPRRFPGSVREAPQ